MSGLLQHAAMKAWFLPIGLILALIIGLSLPAPGNAAYHWQPLDLRFIDITVFIVFIVTGWQMRSAPFEGLSAYARSISSALLINLLLAPLLILLLGLSGVFPAVLLVGASVMACMPTTLSSGIVISTHAGGSETLSLLLTVLLSMVGVFVLPFSITIVLDVGTAIEIPVLGLIIKLSLIVLLPFALGCLLRWCWGRAHKPFVGYIPLSCIVLVVWSVASSKHEAFLGAGWWDVLAAILLGVLMHALLLVVAFISSHLLRLSLPFQKSLVIISSQKTLPIAVAVMAIIESQISAAEMGLGIMVCIIWHFSQTIIDSLIAARWSKTGVDEQ